MRLSEQITSRWRAQYGHFANWVPVCLGLGIGGYFLRGVEPSPTEIGVSIAASLLLVVLARRAGDAVPFMLAVALVLAGGVIAATRANLVATPQLGFRYYGPIQGRIIAVDRSQSDAVRLTLDHVVLERMAPDRTPERVRVSLHGQQGFISPEPGLVVIMTGHLSPPAGPVEPGGFDFQRMAWFDRLGGVGYTRLPVLALDPAGAGLWVARIRAAISQGVQDRLGGEAGPFAAAILTGDRSTMPRDTIDALRATNLAHLLAISGLHMGLLTGAVFAALRIAGALVPVVALHWPVKKLAAGAAIASGALYLALSGGAVATERAFVMVTVMFVAVILDRRAVTLRAVAFAATVILVAFPEELMGPGFQMSFAATTALVAVFGAMRGRGQAVPRWLRPVLGVGMSSLVAGLATAPFGAAHFNQFSHYGLFANLLAVPVMGLLVMPAAVATAVLWLIGAEMIGLKLMELGLRWILWVAHHVADWPEALGHVASPGPWVLPLLSLGALVVVLWRGRERWVGAVFCSAALILWGMAERPVLLISDTGVLGGVMTQDGRSLSRARGNGFAATSWLENDGDPVDQETAAARNGWQKDGRVMRTTVAGQEVAIAAGKTALAEIAGCGGADLLITNQAVDVDLPCYVFDITRLRQSGAVAMMPDGRIITAREVTGDRLWNRAAEPWHLFQ